MPRALNAYSQYIAVMAFVTTTSLGLVLGRSRGRGTLTWDRVASAISPAPLWAL